MSYINHTLHVYQRPKQGTGFIKRYPIYNYQHSIVNRGGFDTASGDIAVHSDTEGQQIVEQYLGCFVAVYVDNPAQPIWEGIINRLTFNSGGSSYTISLDNMANRCSVVITGATNTAVQTSIVNNTTSQAIYGIKQTQIEFGANPGALTTATGQQNSLNSTIIAQTAFPQSSYTQSQGTQNLVHIECIGIFHTLEWEKLFTALDNTGSAIGTAASTHITGLANGETFFDNTNTTLISANASTTSNQQRGTSIWERLLKIAEAGDGTNYWVCGITPTDRNTGKRLFYYQQANSAIEYTALRADGLIARTVYGQKVKPWLVKPDRGIRVSDIVPGYSTSQLTDPSVTYIQSINYDANSQRVQWAGADDTTARAAFLLNSGFKPLSADFGAPTRTIVT